MSDTKKRVSRISRLRKLVALIPFAALAIGLALHTGTGTISTFGWDTVAALCPLGAFESLLGAKAFVPRLIIGALAVVLLIFVAGKAFCAWVCPIPHIGRIFKSKKRQTADEAERTEEAHRVRDLISSHGNGCSGSCSTCGKKNEGVDSRHIVLGTTLLSAAVFGFPVFCLICPIGLTFATFILFWQFLQFNQTTWGLIIFPLIILVEVVVLKKWCHRICPLGALMSLVAKRNRTLQPTVSSEACIRLRDNVPCVACVQTCPEQIDPCQNLGSRPLSECIRCHRCADACPAQAITFPFRSEKTKTLPQSENAQNEEPLMEL